MLTAGAAERHRQMREMAPQIGFQSRFQQRADLRQKLPDLVMLSSRR